MYFFLKKIVSVIINCKQCSAIFYDNFSLLRKALKISKIDPPTGGGKLKIIILERWNLPKLAVIFADLLQFESGGEIRVVMAIIFATLLTLLATKTPFAMPSDRNVIKCK